MPHLVIVHCRQGVVLEHGLVPECLNALDDIVWVQGARVVFHYCFFRGQVDGGTIDPICLP